ncbi:MAG: urea ABC transporter ATP-binding subunit UrtE [Candidatus Latescibacteria bacterium]|nr:urea ABC transporter ATP-binding subunit UrtE [Candidatus Latescibacterota bacterium]
MLAVEDLDVHYGGSRILRDISIDIPRGSIAAIMGRNGVGKTTLLKAIMGLVPPTKGSVRFAQDDITALTTDIRARLGLGYVPQGRDIFPRLTVRENLEIGLEARRDGSKDADPFAEIFELFPVLAEMQSRMGGNLSGGQQQQLAIGRALVGDPDILILDEPTEGIQPSIILEIERVLLALKDRGRFTIILVEQYFDFARQIADYFFLMDRGSILLQGAADELSDDSIKTHLTF